jgi:hypothetical protein
VLVTDLEQFASRKTWDVGERERPVADDLSYPVTPSPKVPSLNAGSPRRPRLQALVIYLLTLLLQAIC